MEQKYSVTMLYFSLLFPMGLFLIQLKTDSLYLPAILLLNMYSKEMQSVHQRDVYTSTFTAALFTVASKWK